MEIRLVLGDFRPFFKSRKRARFHLGLIVHTNNCKLYKLLSLFLTYLVHFFGYQDLGGRVLKIQAGPSLHLCIFLKTVLFVVGSLVFLKKIDIMILIHD